VAKDIPHHDQDTTVFIKTRSGRHTICGGTRHPCPPSGGAFVVLADQRHRCRNMLLDQPLLRAAFGDHVQQFFLAVVVKLLWEKKLNFL